MSEQAKREEQERAGRDRGTFSMFTVLFVPMVLLFAGLLFDGGLAIHARQRALDIAEQAACKALIRSGEPVGDVDDLMFGRPAPQPLAA